MGKQLLFEVNTRYWMYQLRNKYNNNISINLSTVPEEEIIKFADKFDWIWLMGIWDHSSLDKEFLETHPGLIKEADQALADWSDADIVGSPYSIKTYDIHPYLGTRADFIKLKQRFNAAGVKVMVDFVPNHFGIESPHAIENPDYFINLKDAPPRDQKRLFKKVDTSEGTRWIALGKDPYFASWDDTFQVNFRNPNTRSFMIEELISITQISDGVRCDMAMLVNNAIIERTWGWLINDMWEPIDDEFWPGAITKVKERSENYVFMAEVYWDMEWELLQMGFDYTYDKRLYDRFVANNISEIHSHLTADLTYQARMCRFIENHDEPRALETMSPRQSLAAATMIMTLPGITLLHHGQLCGNRIKIPVQLLRKNREIKLQSLQQKYQDIIDYCQNIIPKEAIWHSNNVITASELPSDSLFAWTWQTKESVFVVVVNYTDHKADGLVRLNTNHPIFNHNHVDFIDHYNDERYEWHVHDLKKNGLYVKLEHWGYHLFSIEVID